MDYKKAGVDIEAGYRSVELMKKHVKETMRPEVLGGLGGFAGAFRLDSIKKMEEPVLLSGTDGCGTKVQLAYIMDKHDTIGIDCVAMCVNDIACSGGEPLFFLDYIACGKNYPEKIATIVSGVAEGCKQSGAALVGGETAEHPGLMPVDEYDLAGFAVGVVDKKDLITGENIKPGDKLIGIASSGVHSNGFSLVRKVFEMTEESLNTYYDELGKTLGEALLAPTRIYVKALKKVKEAGVTRISINPQTMHQETLDLIGRAHTVVQTKEAFLLARECGFDNINMDMITGLPGEDISHVHATLDEIFALRPESLTVHSLAIKRAAHLNMEMEKYQNMVKGSTNEMLRLVDEYASNMGMEAYYMYRQKNIPGNLENIGYCVSGKECLYNILIMEEKQDIISCGAGASSKYVFADNRIERTENVKNLDHYINRIDEMIDRKRKYL